MFIYKFFWGHFALLNLNLDPANQNQCRSLRIWAHNAVLWILTGLMRIQFQHFRSMRTRITTLEKGVGTCLGTYQLTAQVILVPVGPVVKITSGSNMLI